MPDVAVVLQNVQEREKWRRRVSLLETALRETHVRRVRLERRLSRLKREIARSTRLALAVRPAAQPDQFPEVTSARRAPPFNR